LLFLLVDKNTSRALKVDRVNYHSANKSSDNDSYEKHVINTKEDVYVSSNSNHRENSASSVYKDKLSDIFEKEKLSIFDKNKVKEYLNEKFKEIKPKRDSDAENFNSQKDVKERFFLNIAYEPKTDFKKLLFDAKEKELRINSSSSSSKNALHEEFNNDNNNLQAKNLNIENVYNKSSDNLNINDAVNYLNNPEEENSCTKKTKDESLYNTINLKADKIDINYKTFNLTFNIPNSFVSTNEVNKNLKGNNNNNIDDDKFEKKLLNKDFSKTIDSFFKHSIDKFDKINIKKIKNEDMEINNKESPQKNNYINAKFANYKEEKMLYFNPNIRENSKHKNQLSEVELRRKIIHEVKKEYKELINENQKIQKRINEKSSNKIMEKIEKIK